MLIEDAKVKPAHSKLYPCPLFLSNFDLTMVYFLLPPKIEKREWRALKKAPSLFRLRIKSTRTDANASFSFTLRVHASKKFSQIEFRSRARAQTNSFALSRETSNNRKERKRGGNLRAQRKMSKSKHIVIDAISYLHHWHVQNGLHAGNASNRRFRHRLLVRVFCWV